MDNNSNLNSAELTVMATDPTDRLNFAFVNKGPTAAANAEPYRFVEREGDDVYVLIFLGGIEDHADWVARKAALRAEYRNSVLESDHLTPVQVVETRLLPFIRNVRTFYNRFGLTATPLDIKVAANGIFYGANQTLMFPDAPYQFTDEIIQNMN